MSELRQKAYDGLAWSALERFGQQGIRFGIQLVLARLLAPEQFGLLAMVAVFVAIGVGLADAGFSQAIIQRQDLEDRDLSAVFFFNIAFGILMAGLLWAGAPLVAALYQEAQLTPILRVICFSVVLTSFGQIHLAQLSKALRFRRIACAVFPATVISGVVAIVMAVRGWGVWALAAQVLIQQGLQSILLWVSSPWRPSLTFSLTSLRSLFSYGSRLAVAGVIDQVFKNIYVLFIGKFFAPVDVGFYQRADSFKRMGAENLNAIVARVTFPLYSSIQADPQRLRKAFLRTTSLLALLFFPLMATLAGMAHPLIGILLGERWLPAAPYLQLLCVVGALYPLHAANLSVLKALGRSDLFLRLELIKRALTLVLLLATFKFGISAMILGQIVGSFLSLWINAFYTRKLIALSYWHQFREYFAPVVLGGVIFTTTSWATSSSPPAALWCLGYGLLAAASTATVGLYILRNLFAEEVQYAVERFPCLKPIARTLYVES